MCPTLSACPDPPKLLSTVDKLLSNVATAGSACNGLELQSSARCCKWLERLSAQLKDNMRTSYCCFHVHGPVSCSHVPRHNREGDYVASSSRHLMRRRQCDTHIMVHVNVCQHAAAMDGQPRSDNSTTGCIAHRANRFQLTRAVAMAPARMIV